MTTVYDLDECFEYNKEYHHWRLSEDCATTEGNGYKVKKGVSIRSYKLTVTDWRQVRTTLLTPEETDVTLEGRNLISKSVFVESHKPCRRDWWPFAPKTTYPYYIPGTKVQYTVGETTSNRYGLYSTTPLDHPVYNC